MLNSSVISEPSFDGPANIGVSELVRVELYARRRGWQMIAKLLVLIANMFAPGQ